MAAIFRNAERVLVSLGDKADDAEYLFKWAYELYNASESPEPRSLWGVPEDVSHAIDAKEVRKGGRPAMDHVTPPRSWVIDWFDKITPDGFQRFAAALTVMGRHPYWQRMWYV